MDTLKSKKYANYDYISRYSDIPYFYDELMHRETYGIGTNLKKTTEYVTHKVVIGDTLNSLALKYYSNPTFWWIIAYFNDIQDAFIAIDKKYTKIKIPSIIGIEFGRVNE